MPEWKCEAVLRAQERRMRLIPLTIGKKLNAMMLAINGHNGITRAVRPAHSIYDGDTVFAMCTGETEAAFDAVGVLASLAVEQAIVNAIKNAGSLCGYPAYRDIFKL